MSNREEHYKIPDWMIDLDIELSESDTVSIGNENDISERIAEEHNVKSRRIFDYLQMGEKYLEEIVNKSNTSFYSIEVYDVSGYDRGIEELLGKKDTSSPALF